MKKTSNKIITEITNQSVEQTESWWMLETLTGKNKEELIREETIDLSPEQHNRLQSWIDQRVNENKPLQYILGTVPFCDLEIRVEPPVLIPRPETEEWCNWLIKQLAPIKDERITILDLGVGSGCIALALAKAYPYANVIGVDIHPNAIRLSEINKSHNNVPNAIFIKSNLYGELGQYKGMIDLIVSNPPYISEKEFSGLSKDVIDWEDKSALVAHDDGFAIHQKILQDAKAYLKPDSVFAHHNLPRILLEFGKGQEKHLQEIFDHANFKSIQTQKDLESVPRWMTATL